MGSPGERRSGRPSIRASARSRFSSSLYLRNLGLAFLRGETLPTGVRPKTVAELSLALGLSRDTVTRSLETIGPLIRAMGRPPEFLPRDADSAGDGDEPEADRRARADHNRRRRRTKQAPRADRGDD